MAAISFQFDARLPVIQQDQVLKRIRSLTGVVSADRIDPDSDDAVASRMCIAETTDPNQAEQVLQHLQRLSGVEQASVEAPRGLVF